MRRGFILFVLVFAVTGISAQDEDEYKMEIGGGVGLVSYEGDFNGNILKDSVFYTRFDLVVSTFLCICLSN